MRAAETGGLGIIHEDAFTLRHIKEQVIVAHAVLGEESASFSGGVGFEAGGEDDDAILLRDAAQELQGAGQPFILTRLIAVVPHECAVEVQHPGVRERRETKGCQRGSHGLAVSFFPFEKQQGAVEKRHAHGIVIPCVTRQGEPDDGMDELDLGKIRFLRRDAVEEGLEEGFPAAAGNGEPDALLVDFASKVWLCPTTVLIFEESFMRQA